MKHILNYGLMAAMVAAVTFTSCSKDNEEDENELSILPKKVTKIESSNQFTYEFDSDGRIFKTTNAFYSTTYQYTNNSVIVSYAIMDINDTTIIQFETKNGRITSAKYLESIDDGVYKETNKMKYSYSADGYLSTMKSTIYGSVSNSNYCVENGVVKSISGDGDGIVISSKFTYNSKILNNLNINLWYVLYNTEPLFGDKLGKRFVQLPTSYTAVGKDGEEEESMSCDFSYEYDGDYLKKITSIISYDGETETTTYEIFYEE